MKRVVVHLVGGDYCSTYHRTVAEAEDFIGFWMDRVSQRIATGNAKEMDVLLLADSGASGKPHSAILANMVIGMHLAEDVPSVQERAVAAMEKMTKDIGGGEEWKG